MKTPRLVARRPRGRVSIALGGALLLALGLLGYLFNRGLNVSKSLSSASSTGSSQATPVLTKDVSVGADEGGEEENDPELKKSDEEKAFEKGAVSEDSKVNYLDPKLDDPMASFIVGYPMAPMSLQDLKLCDAEQTIMLHGSFKCPDDPSCLKCVPPHAVSRFRELIGAFRDPEIEQARKAQLKKDFAGQHTVVMFTFNYAHSDLFLNWACSAHKLGMNVKDFTLVIPCDDKSTELVKSLGFKILDPAWLKLLKKPIKSTESYWGQDHADINNVALFMMNDLVELGFHVFVHDADVAWIRDPFPFFKNSIRRRDFLGMLAPFWNSMGPVNTG